LLDGRGQWRVVVPETGNGDTAECIQILLAVIIVQIAPITVRKVDGQRSIDVNEMI